MLDTFHRAMNGIRKLAAGLRPFSESVWPGVRNDLFVAHESIYRFCARFAAGADVLDAGCGTGYGTFLLASSGAASAFGVDNDPNNVRYARRHYRAPGLRFELADIECLAFPDDSFGLVVASNSLEHLHSPEAFLDALRRMLRAGGRAVVAVPPIYTPHDVRVHTQIEYHRSNLRVHEWADLMANAGFELSGVLHEAPGTLPDLRSHRRSVLTPDHFAFTEVPVEALWRQPSITAIFVLRRPAR